MEQKLTDEILKSSISDVSSDNDEENVRDDEDEFSEPAVTLEVECPMETAKEDSSQWIFKTFDKKASSGLSVRRERKVQATG
jgi:hypothetical protein